MHRNLKIASWNIQGIKEAGNINQVKFLDISQDISKYDIYCLQETHLAPGDSLQVPGYQSISKCRKKLPNGPYHSGGISVFFRDNISSGISVQPSNSNDIIWLRLKQKFFNLSNDIYLCYTYNSPQNSSYTIRQN